MLAPATLTTINGSTGAGDSGSVLEPRSIVRTICAEHGGLDREDLVDMATDAVMAAGDLVIIAAVRQAVANLVTVATRKPAFLLSACGGEFGRRRGHVGIGAIERLAQSGATAPQGANVALQFVEHISPALSVAALESLPSAVAISASRPATRAARPSRRAVAAASSFSRSVTASVDLREKKAMVLRSIAVRGGATLPTRPLRGHSHISTRQAAERARAEVGARLGVSGH
jgi:hypothetical protein